MLGRERCGKRNRPQAPSCSIYTQEQESQATSKEVGPRVRHWRIHCSNPLSSRLPCEILLILQGSRRLRRSARGAHDSRQERCQ